MPSPFPGLDPYLEAHWGDVHTSLMVYVADAVQEQLPGDLFARVLEELDVHADAKFLQDEPITRRHVEIRDQSIGGEVVTAIEVLSPTDKSCPENRSKYKQKQREYLHDGVNLVEVDLIRSGEHAISPPQQSIPRDRRTGLYASVHRSAKYPLAELYTIAFDTSLPVIPIPLRPTDQDIRLDLQALLTQAYDRGRYAATIDYTEDSDPPLPPNASEWADQLLRTAGKRQ